MIITVKRDGCWAQNAAAIDAVFTCALDLNKHVYFSKRLVATLISCPGVRSTFMVTDSS
jgi:hypothetical protein